MTIRFFFISFFRLGNAKNYNSIVLKNYYVYVKVQRRHAYNSSLRIEQLPKLIMFLINFKNLRHSNKIHVSDYKCI